MKIIAILSCSFSGSTLLNLMLGSHSQALDLTELGSYATKKRNDFFCKLCQPPESCPIWSPYVIQSIKKIGASCEIYKLIAQITEKNVLVDSSKSISWFDRVLHGINSRDVLCIHISKSPEEFAGSELNKFDRNKHLQSIAEIGDKWWRTNAAILTWFNRSKYKTTSIRYRDLVDHPKEVLNFLLSKINLQYENNMEAYWTFEHHPLSGNRGAFSHFSGEHIWSSKKMWRSETELNKNLHSRHHQTIFRDEKWRKTINHKMVDQLYQEGRVEPVARLLGYFNPNSELTKLSKNYNSPWKPVNIVGSRNHQIELYVSRMDILNWKIGYIVRHNGVRYAFKVAIRRLKNYIQIRNTSI